MFGYFIIGVLLVIFFMTYINASSEEGMYYKSTENFGGRGGGRGGRGGGAPRGGGFRGGMGGRGGGFGPHHPWGRGGGRGMHHWRGRGWGGYYPGWGGYAYPYYDWPLYTSYSDNFEVCKNLAVDKYTNCTNGGVPNVVCLATLERDVGSCL